MCITETSGRISKMDSAKQDDQIRHARVTPFSIDDILGKCRDTDEIVTKGEITTELSYTVIQRELRDIQSAVKRRKQLTCSTDDVGRKEVALSASGVDNHDILTSCWKMTEKLERDAKETLDMVSRGSAPPSPVLKGKKNVTIHL